MSLMIHISVENRIARLIGSPQIICGNSNYFAAFYTDSEWDAYTDKTAHFRFIRDGKPETISVDFTGAVCSMPVLTDIDFVEIGISAGDIRTTTPARVSCLRCITDIPSDAYTQQRDVYNELMDALQEVLHPLPKLPAGYVFVVSAEGDYITASDGSYMIVKE